MAHPIDKLSARELRVLAANFLSQKSKADTDFDKMATLCGHKNGATARATFYQIYRKVQETLNDTEAGQESSSNEKPDKPSKNSTPKKRKAKNKDANEKSAKRVKEDVPVKTEDKFYDSSDESSP